MIASFLATQQGEAVGERSEHIDIRGGKVWIQHDGTEKGVVEELVELGIPRNKIVLAFHNPEMRKYTPYAVA